MSGSSLEIILLILSTSNPSLNLNSNRAPHLFNPAFQSTRTMRTPPSFVASYPPSGFSTSPFLITVHRTSSGTDSAHQNGSSAQGRDHLLSGTLEGQVRAGGREDNNGTESEAEITNLESSTNSGTGVPCVSALRWSVSKNLRGRFITGAKPHKFTDLRLVAQ